MICRGWDWLGGEVEKMPQKGFLKSFGAFLEKGGVGDFSKGFL